MKIISHFHDYYDVVSNVYGVDPKIVWNRNILHLDNYIRVVDEPIIDIPEIKEIKHQLGYLGRYDDLQTLAYKEGVAHIELLVVCGLPFYVCRMNDSWEDLDGFHKRHIKGGLQMPSPEMLDAIMIHVRNQKPFSEPRRYLKRIAADARSPIFIIQSIEQGYSNRPTKFNLVDHIPCLANIKGFAKLYPAEQLYQDVSYWIGNVMNGSPDVMPPANPEQTQVEKAEAHGFDKRVSFRHRK